MGVVPPLLLVALNTTVVPLHTLLAETFTVTIGVTVGAMLTFILLEVTTGLVAQATDDVICKLTESLLAKTDVVNISHCHVDNAPHGENEEADDAAQDVAGLHSSGELSHQHFLQANSNGSSRIQR